MSRVSDSNFAPRNGHTLVVGIGARISGCQNQKELSLEDQEDNAKDWLKSIYDGPADFRVIATTGKGERLDRPELLQFEAAYRSGKFDIFIFDDLSRLIRGGEATRLLGVGVDHGVRTISIADGIDTVDENWEVDSLNACSENVAHNQRTSMRIKQKTMNRFKKTGATSRRRVFGYIVPPGAKSYDDWQKDPGAEPYILEGARILRTTLNGAAVADYFRRNHVPVGPYARRGKWDSTMALRFFRNTILKGMPQRGLMTSVKHHGTGKRSSKKNPNGPNFYAAPHLAFFAAEEFDSLVEALRAANANRRRKKIDGIDPRENVPRKRTIFPGQMVDCGICGRQFVISGGRHLMCSGAHAYSCWNAASFAASLAADRIAVAICDAIDEFHGFDEEFLARIQEESQKLDSGRDLKLRSLSAEFVTLERQIAHLLNFIKGGDSSSTVRSELQALERDRNRVSLELEKIRTDPSSAAIIPHADEVKRLAGKSFQSLAHDSYEFANAMRRLIGRITVFPYRLCDGGHIVLRARFQLNLAGMLEDDCLKEVLRAPLERTVCVDLFEYPQRVACLAQMLELRQTMSECKAAERLKITVTTTQKAAAMHRRMRALGLADPYMPVLGPTDDFGRIRRFRHSRYRFEPLPGFPIQPW
jgi:site-specific DNA recombinase